MNHLLTIIRSATLLVICALLAACGGSSSDGPAPKINASVNGKPFQVNGVTAVTGRYGLWISLWEGGLDANGNPLHKDTYIYMSLPLTLGTYSCPSVEVDFIYNVNGSNRIDRSRDCKVEINSIDGEVRGSVRASAGASSVEGPFVAKLPSK